MRRYTTDTRTLQPGDTFVAVRGERTDGHVFIPDAIAKGAAGLIVEAGAWPEPAHRPAPGAVEVVQVPDTVIYLGQEAQRRIAELQPLIVAVTGSIGKTTTKNAIATVLSQAKPVITPKGNLNTLLGLSLTLLNELHDSGQVVVAEMGAYQRGDLAQICAYIRPAISVVTNVRPVHLERMGSLENVALAKAEIVTALPESGTACLNADDPLVRQMAEVCRGRVITYGTGEAADISRNLIKVPIPLLGAYQVYTALAAYSVGRCLGMTDEAINAGIAQMRPEKGRLKSLPGINGSRLIDDTYNASQESSLAALEVLATQPAERRFAVLGDMLELGPQGADMHAAIAADLAEQNIDLVFAAGPLMRHLFDAAAPAQRGLWAATAAELAEPLKQALRSGDAVMIKGSNGSRMGPLANGLKQHFGGA